MMPRDAGHATLEGRVGKLSVGSITWSSVNGAFETQCGQSSLEIRCEKESELESDYDEAKLSSKSPVSTPVLVSVRRRRNTCCSSEQKQAKQAAFLFLQSKVSIAQSLWKINRLHLLVG